MKTIYLPRPIPESDQNSIYTAVESWINQFKILQHDVKHSDSLHDLTTQRDGMDHHFEKSAGFCVIGFLQGA